MESLKPLSYVCAECGKSFNFSFQESMNRFIGLHKVQHQLQELKWKKDFDTFVLTEFYKNFLKDCGVAV